MLSVKLDLPTSTFPYKIPRRLNLLSRPRRDFFAGDLGMPAFTETGTRQSAITGGLGDRNYDIAWPYIRRLVLLKRMYKNKFSEERLVRIDRMIEASNVTTYSKLANCAIDLKRTELKDMSRRKKGWSDTEWKKHMEYISQIAEPKKLFPPPPVQRGKSKPLKDLQQRLEFITYLPEFKCYKKISEEAWYKNPEKVAPNALKYQITERTKKLAVARATPQTD